MKKLNDQDEDDFEKNIKESISSLKYEQKIELIGQSNAANGEGESIIKSIVQES